MRQRLGPSARLLAAYLGQDARREYYEKPTSMRKRKAAAAVKRHLKKLQRENRRFERSY